MERIEEELPEIIIGDPGFDFNFEGNSDGFSVQLAGESTDKLSELSAEVMRILRKIEGMSGIRSDLADGDLEVQITVDRDRAMAVGLDTRTVAGAVAVAMRGDNLREFRGENGDIAVRLAYRDSDRQSLENLADLPLFTARGLGG